VGPVTDRRPLVWGVRHDNHLLRAAVNDFLFAEQVLVSGNRIRACRDLEEIRAAGALRLVTRNSPTTCTIERGGLEGFETDLATALCRRLGLRLELSIPPPGIDPLDWLEDGHGDVAALHEPEHLGRQGQFLTTSPYRWVDLVAVVAAGRPRPAAVDDLAGATLAASAATASWFEMLPLEPPALLLEPPAGGDALNALLEVSRGTVDAAVVDADTARLELQHRAGLQRALVVLPEVPLVWVLNPSSPRLHAAIDGFLRRERRSGLIRQLARSTLGTWRPYVPPHLPKVPPGALTPYDERLKWEGRQHGIDWRLLASLMYEESRFDPDAVGPGGSAGLFQFMPFTWQELGVEDPHHPGEAVAAGARYLRSLMDDLPGVPMADQVAMAIASYNVGPRHVFDARRLAREMNLDPDRWRGNVETAMLLLDNPEVARRFPAGVCRCRRAVGYTRRILRRYAAYREQFPPE
jgi:membrane-bound lytic murein transglycosylase F